MKVISRKGTTCPKEGKPREHITDAEAVDVPETSYYLRLIADGSLLPAEGASFTLHSGETTTTKGGKQ